MKKSLMLVTGMLFALSSVVARADHGDRGGGGASSRDSGQGHQGVSTSPGNNDPAEHGNPQAPEDENQDDRDFLVFGSMIGVGGSFVGSDAIRGVMGDALPWMVDKARGSLSASGRLRINVSGLVFTNDPSVPANQRGVNDEATFRGLVSCLSEKSGGGGIVTVNVMTDPFPATPAGNSEINGSVTLPAQCIAPIVFVMNGAGDKWLAVIGSEATGP
jgi:hypothetical protein